MRCHQTRNLLITGGAGFIGSNFIEYILDKYISYKVVNLDLLTYAGNLDNLKSVESNPRYIFVHGDICDKSLVDHIFSKYHIDSVIHFAAESHVDNSIETPAIFVTTNVLGTHNLLESARSYWQRHKIKGRFHHISTDEVYGSLGPVGAFHETTAYAPNSPYSASKAGSDMLVRAYHHTYGLDTIITNCSNNFGPKQHVEKLIPMIIRHAINGEDIPIYGDGKNIRDWLFVGDHCYGIDLAFHSGISGESYNIGGNNEWQNLDLAKLICSILDTMSPKKNNQKYESLIRFVQDRAGHDRRYAIDFTKIQSSLGYKPQGKFIEQLTQTIKYYLQGME